MQKHKNWAVAYALGTLMLLGCFHSSQAITNLPHTQSSHAVDLASHNWVLHTASTPAGEQDTQWLLPATDTQSARTVAIDFLDQQRLTVQRLCNAIHGRYVLEGQDIKIDRLVSTLMTCNQPALMALEQKVGQQLPKVRTWAIDEDEAEPLLTLTFENGASWVFKGMPTNETLYGKSQRMFLEVGAHKVACHDPNMRHTQCLHVRELRYDDRGIKQAATAWQNFYGDIQGYTHQSGVRNVLRLNRYTRSDAPTDTSRSIYVLDMVVESEIIR